MIKILNLHTIKTNNVLIYTNMRLNPCIFADSRGRLSLQNAPIFVHLQTAKQEFIGVFTLGSRAKKKTCAEFLHKSFGGEV